MDMSSRMSSTTLGARQSTRYSSCLPYESIHSMNDDENEEEEEECDDEYNDLPEPWRTLLRKSRPDGPNQWMFIIITETSLFSVFPTPLPYC